MRATLKRLATPVLQRFVKWYFQKPRTWRYKDLSFTVLPGVFFPHMTFSTRMLLEQIDRMEVEGRQFLELGSGTGAMSILAAKKGAKVTATDINPTAVENTTLNALAHQLTIEAYVSDLFESIPVKTFDYIFINPPYYRKNPQTVEEKAWYCGEHFEYFNRLFASMHAYAHDATNIIMILSQDCEIEAIQNIASSSNWMFELCLEKKQWGETNYIFSLQLAAAATQT